MSAPAQDAPPAGTTEPREPEGAEEGTAEEEGEEGAEERPQDAWESRKDLRRHSPAFMLGDSARLGGSLVYGSQYGVSGGHVGRDVVLGNKTEIYQIGYGATQPAASSGEVPEGELERLAALFAADEDELAHLEARLRAERFLVLTGSLSSGRRMAALMLLRRLGVAPVRALDRDLRPGDLPHHLKERSGHVLCDLVTDPGSPLREAQMLAVRDQLADKGSYLVLTTGPGAAGMEGVLPARWRSPSAALVLRGHLTALTDEATARDLLRLDAVRDVLAHRPQPREAAGLARLLVTHAGTGSPVEATEALKRALEQFSTDAVERQVQQWFDNPALPLRDKAFLVSLAAFNEAPYALTAELSDQLFALLHRTEDRGEPLRIPVFGTSIETRLQLARARSYTEEEATEWGPVIQVKAAYEDERAALVLLREVWTGHPSSRPALTGWLRKLADDGRPLVRTRAASTAAVLLTRDLPSALALLVQGWADSSRPHRRVTAAHTLALAHALGAPNLRQVVGDWSRSDQPRLRWTAIRTYALIGEQWPEEALDALRAVVAASASRAQEGGRGADSEETVEEEMTEAASSTALLLLSPAGQTVYQHLLAALREKGAARELALRAFLTACEWTDDTGTGPAPERPVLLNRYGHATAARTVATPATTAAPGPAPEEEAYAIATLWAEALRDRGHTAQALRVLADWVRCAEGDPAAEWALSTLLPALARSRPDHERLSHLLRTMPAQNGGPPPPVAARLHTALTAH
ncbi:hypothetical protein ITI46_30460 [Streptomyces oryzae]|uniref:HEAT repeat domain-containing protein n=1 Tax=Streptomyces oryzae TaxID=1434886 RepID=A0ABS3XKV0_9ACTN|nr:hypothetical protein [Streptomyces oryzae]MBO8195938.1 hypothetical protein [Streptomyces oryzae]